MSTTVDTKIAVIIREDLPVWQKLNVTAFMMGGIASLPGLTGENYADASGRVYLPMIRQPVLIFAASSEQIRSAYERALGRLDSEIQMSIYTEELFATSNDEANRAAVKQYGSDELRLVGIAVFGRKKAVDKLVKGLSLHP